MRAIYRFAVSTFACCLLLGCGGHVPSAGKIVPADDTIWHGEWKSTEYPMIYGSLASRIPPDLFVGRYIELPVAIRFDDASIYRAGETHVAQYRGVMISSLAARGGSVPTDTGADSKTLARTFKIASVDGAEALASNFKIYFNNEMDYAEGYWKSPTGESGTFSLSRK